MAPYASAAMSTETGGNKKTCIFHDYIRRDIDFQSVHKVGIVPLFYRIYLFQSDEESSNIASMFRYSSIPYHQSRIDDPFWNKRLKVNHEQSLPAQYSMCKRTGRIDALKLKWKPGDPRKPHIFWDSDTAKWLEAACYACRIRPDEIMQGQIDEVARLFVEAQQPDGYLNSYFSVTDQDRRWKNLKFNHELYCAGHLFEAAIAHYELTNSTELLDAACRFADYIDSVFGLEAGKIPGYPGHEEIELALVKLYRVTGNDRYLKLSSYFVEQRGCTPSWFDQEAPDIAPDMLVLGAPPKYFQDHAPVREQNEAVGHVVRAVYLYCAMADLAREQEDLTLLTACEALWKDITESKLYLTGGIGSTWQGEAFTDAYDLPNQQAYCETCASVALAFWANRMLQHNGSAQYADIIERVLYNSALVGMSLDGRRFFYQNPLASYGTHRRQDWFACSCCPSNLSRLLATLGGYIYSQGENTLLVHQYIGGDATFSLVGGVNGTIRQQGEFLERGDMTLTLSLNHPKDFTLGLRIPSWAGDTTVSINGREAAAHIDDGYAYLHQHWQSGDTIDIHCSQSTRRIECHPQVIGNGGHVALQRGPFIYCIEDADFQTSVLDVSLPADALLSPETITIADEESVTALKGRGMARQRKDADALYVDAETVMSGPVPFCAIPYYAWDNRRAGAMRVWIPVG